MKKSFLPLLMGLALALPSAAQKGSELFERALVKERTAGDYQGAMKIYQEILRKHTEDRPLIAKTLVQLAQCYEKQGSSEAMKLYGRVMREFADQRAMASIAQDRLAALAPKASARLTVRQVWSPAIDTWGSPSADGRLLSFVDWETGDLAIRDLTTGENRRLMNKGSWKERTGEAEGSKLSPDGKQVVYMWQEWGDASRKGYELRLMRTDGTGDRLLFHLPNRGYVEPYGWSPDGKTVAFEALPTGTLGRYQITLIDVASGAVKVLHTLEARRPLRGHFSPDGRWLAYSAPASAQSRSMDIYVLDVTNPVAGRLEMPLLEGTADDRLMGWSSDGAFLLFWSDRRDTKGAWLLPVKEGVRAGEPILVKPDLGDADAVGLTQTGQFLYSIRKQVNEVLEVGFDPVKGNIEGEPAKSPHGGIYSPDGKMVLSRVATEQSFRIRDTDSGAIRIVRPQLTDLSRSIWHPNSRDLIVEGVSVDGKQAGIYFVNGETGNTRLLMERRPGWIIGQMAISNDAKTLYYKHDHFTIHARNLETNEVRMLYQTEHGGGAIFQIALSPDNKTLAVMHPRQLRLIATSDGSRVDRLNHGDKPGEMGLRSVAWTHDGEYILLGVTNDDRNNELWTLPVASGGPHVTKLAFPAFGLILHPAGNRLTIGTTKSERELWALENFLTR